MNVGKHEVEHLVATAEMTFSGLTRRNTNPAAINATATATVAQVVTGVITSTSAAATTITMPTATALATALNASKHSTFDIIVDNSAGADAVVLSGGTDIVYPTTAGLMSTASNKVSMYRIYFSSVTVTSGAISAATAEVMLLGDMR